MLPVVGDEHQIPDCGSRWIFGINSQSMVAALAVDGEGFHFGILGENGLAVFYSQNIIGLGENVRLYTHTF